MLGFLIKNYHVSQERVVRLGEWAAELLNDPKVLLNPNAARLESTTNCQLRCPECPIRKKDNDILGRGYLTYDAFLKFIKANPQVKRIELSNYGEPFLNPELAKILVAGEENGITFTFVNGSNFNHVTDETLEAIVKARVERISFSIDGASNQTYQQYRVGGDFDRVIDNIRRLNRYKAQYHADYPRLTWQFVVMKSNYHETLRAKQMAVELGMSISYTLDRREDFTPDNEAELMRITGLKSTRYSDNKARLVRSMKAVTCSQMVWSPQINWDGRLLGCCYSYKRDWGENVFDSDLRTVMNTDRYRKMIQFLFGGQGSLDADTPCRICSQWENIFKPSHEEKIYLEM